MIIQILTKNNDSTIQQTIESIINLNLPIEIGDLGSNDNTLDICRSFNIPVTRFNCERHHARNQLAQKSDFNFYIEPWEILVQGHKHLPTTKSSAYVSVLQNQILTKEIRVWQKSQKFINPVFERLAAPTDNEIEVLLYSQNKPTDPNLLSKLDQWLSADMLNIEPYYLKGLLLLQDNHYEEFLNLADHILFVHKKWDLVNIMTRYYVAFVTLRHKKLVKPTLQNLSVCLAYRPLMAEFWCLLGDVYYHLMHNFKFAIEFYENAMLLGQKRLKKDKWPMDIEKYNNYPKKMIASCQEIMSTTSFYL